jgi:chromate transporter
MVLGLGRAGWSGALCAWFSFTFPSGIALILFALGVNRWAGLAQAGAIHGLKVFAVVIVAQAVLGMAKTLCPNRFRVGIATVTSLLVLAVPSALSQIGAIVAGGIAGRWAVQVEQLPVAEHRDYGVRKSTGAAMLLLLGLLLVVLPVLAVAIQSPALSVISSF